MTFFQHKIFNVNFYTFCSFILAAIIIDASCIVSPDNPNFKKLSADECGFDPYEDARNNFDVCFYLISLLFLVFDLEIIFCSLGVSVLVFLIHLVFFYQESVLLPFRLLLLAVLYNIKYL